MAKQLIAWGVCVSPERYIELAALHEATESQFSFAEAAITEGSRAHLEIESDVETGGRELIEVCDRIDARAKKESEKLIQQLARKKQSVTTILQALVCSLDCKRCQDEIVRTPGRAAAVISG